jgi:hypothetical protein
VTRSGVVEPADKQSGLKTRMLAGLRMQGMQTAGTAQGAQCGMTFSFPRRAKAEKCAIGRFSDLRTRQAYACGLLTAASRAKAQCFSFCKGDGVRFRLPLRDSSGFAPDSLSAACWKSSSSAGQPAALPMKRTNGYDGESHFIGRLAIGQAANAGNPLQKQRGRICKVVTYCQRHPA